MRIILNADTGIDDALALAYLVACCGSQLTDVVASYGNVSAETARWNTLVMSELLPSPGTDVWRGCSKPSWAQGFIPDAGCAVFHGANGLADLDPRSYGALMHGTALRVFPDYMQLMQSASAGDPHISVGGYRADDPHAQPSCSISDVENSACSEKGACSEVSLCSDIERLRAEVSAELASELGIAHEGDLPPGVAVIIDAAREAELMLIVTGPLTDVDMALRLAPDILPNLHIVAMGGALMVPGNCYDGVAETNIIQDPEAALRVFSSGADITLVGLDVTERCLLSRESVQSWRGATPAGEFLADLAQFSIAANAKASPRFAQGMPLHDPLAAAVALDPSLVSTLELPLTVQLRTQECAGVRGRVVVDAEKLADPHAPRVKVAIDVDVPRFVQRFVQTVAN